MQRSPRLPAMLLVASLILPQSPASPSRPATLADGWKTGTAETAGLDPARLAALTASARSGADTGVHAILIERGGRLVYEEYFTAPDQRWGRVSGSGPGTWPSSARSFSMAGSGTASR